MAGVPSGALEWVRAWFERNSPLPGSTPEDRLRTDFFDAGLVDSLTVVQLVTDIERTFSIRFEDRHYQDSRFSTIGGLAEIIDELSAAGRP